jgi:hypothetical protein
VEEKAKAKAKAKASIGKSAALTEDSSAFSLSDISAGVFIPWRGGTDESGAAQFLLDLRGPPDGEVAAGADFFLAITVGGGDRVVE